MFSAGAVGTHGDLEKKVGRGVEMYEQVPSEVANKTREGKEKNFKALLYLNSEWITLEKVSASFRENYDVRQEES